MKWITLVAVCTFALVDARTFLYPTPQEYKWTDKIARLSEDFHFHGIQNPILEKAARRYLKLIRKERWEPVQVATQKTTVTWASNPIQGIQFEVTDNKASLDFGVDESYHLTVPETGGYVLLKAKTWVGALRALETFSQLVTMEKKSLVVHTIRIKDSPTYPHRGLLLDTSRNFFPVKHILKTIEAMSFNKMNVLHWHATDSQSWPLYFKSHPELSQKGAYSPKETYLPQDVSRIIQFAKEQGIRVMLEIDMPAHTASIVESHPDYILCSDEFWAAYAAEPPAGQLDPLNQDAFKLVKDIVKEATDIFPDHFYHIGGDEINTGCWELSHKIKEHTKQHNITTKELWFEWENKLLDYVIQTLNKRPVMWEDPLKDGGHYPKKTVIQTWLTPPGNYTALGHDVIVSNYDYFYLDCGHGGWVGEDDRYISPTQQETASDTFNHGGGGGSWCSPFKTWQRIYSYDMTYGIKSSDKGKVIGGEIALWSEQSGPTVLDGRLWPRSAAAAEVYWSGSYDTSGKRRTVKNVSERFYDWVYHLQARGIDAEPVQPKYCAKHPHACDLNAPESQ
ncbi:Beta-hexosaminidase 1 [Choanephora cucurbitarum]|uniref:Beta-hexosaminidase n=1 Tax=Choanephora cucurbitarum TaxID=101091 RepID=A0A1C7N280_9FUNG|nr:Beta-hexosaminidase 1 [Choanephora cucurbitarum]